MHSSVAEFRRIGNGGDPIASDQNGPIGLTDDMPGIDDCHVSDRVGAGCWQNPVTAARQNAARRRIARGYYALRPARLGPGEFLQVFAEMEAATVREPVPKAFFSSL